MIEDAGAVAQIDDILAVPGVDVAFIGPNDLANTLGVPVGIDNQHPDHVAAVQKVVEAGKRAGVPTGIHCGDGAEVARRIEQGMQWMPLASDVRVLRWGFDQQLAAVKAGASEAGGDESGTFY